MANPEHLKILKQGVKAWNEWIRKCLEEKLGSTEPEFDGSYIIGSFDLSGARVGWTKFANTDLTGTRGLNALYHLGPSTIGLDTVERARGGIPDAFLRSAGYEKS